MKLIKGRSHKMGRMWVWLTTFSLLTCLSCQSQPVSLKAKGKAFKELEQNGVTMAIRFMATDELLARHGPQEVNPFISGRYVFYERYLIVFALEINNTTDNSFELQTGAIDMKFNSRLLKPVALFNFEDHWRLRDVVEKTTKKNSEQKQKKIRELVLPESLTIEPHGFKSGYVVFMTSELPACDHIGEAELSIPLLGLTMKQAYDFLFYYTFY